MRLPKASALGGAVRGAVAVAVDATSTGSPAGTGSDGVGSVGAESVGAGSEGGGADSLVASSGESWVADCADGGGSDAESSSPGESSSQMPPTATSTITSATITQGSQAGARGPSS